MGVTVLKTLRQINAKKAFQRIAKQKDIKKFINHIQQQTNQGSAFLKDIILILYGVSAFREKSKT